MTGAPRAHGAAGAPRAPRASRAAGEPRAPGPGHEPPAPPPDPVFLELLRHALGSIVDEMALVVARTARSATVRDALDYSTALCAADGTMIAQGLGIALHLGSFPSAVGAIRRGYRGRIHPGDVFILNDPYGWGGIHLPDIYVIRPVFHEQVLVAFACVVAHHVDVGGIVAGSNSTAATEVYQEGLRIPGVKLFERGVRNEAIVDILRANVRVPDQVLGDLDAEVSAARAGERGFLRLIERHGAAAVADGAGALLDLAERRARAEIRTLPAGTFRFRAHIDHDSVDPEPVVIAATVTIDPAAGELLVDLRGSSRQVRGGINSPFPFSASGVYAAVRLILDPDIPDNAGYFRAIRVRAPKGTVVNPVLPAACGARGITGFRVMEAVLGALAQAVPERVAADGEGGNTLISIGGRGAAARGAAGGGPAGGGHAGRGAAGSGHAGRPFVYTELFSGARGGSARGDGAEGIPHPGSNNANMPVEVAESAYPIRFERYEIVPDTGGAGRFRGANAQAREFRYLGERTTLQLRSDKRRFRPYGLVGGSEGSPSLNTIDPGLPGERTLPTIGPSEIRSGETFRHVLAGGGGWGDPLERDPSLVSADVLAEHVSPAAAARDYAVVVDASGVVDVPATEYLRERRRRGT